MAALAAKFCFWFMIFFIILWMIYILCSRLLDFILSRVLGVSVRFRVGWRCLRHLVVKFEKGAIESVLADEIKLSLRSLINLGVGFLREDKKMQVSICKLQVKMRFSAALFCDELSVSSDFGYDREVGMVIRSMEILCGDVSLKFNEDSFPKSKRSSSSVQDEVGTSSTTALSAKKQLLAKVAKYSTYVPEKVSFSLPKLDIIYKNREHDLLAKNNITGIKLTSVKSKPVEYTRGRTRLDIRLELSEIHLFKETESSVLEIMKVYVESSIEIPIQDLPIRADIDIQLGGTRCNLLISRLKPWLRLHFLNQRNMVLEEETHTLENSEASLNANMKTVLWRGTVSAPEMTIMLYAIDGLPMYHFCSQSSHVFVNNYLSRGTTMDVELGELNLHLGDEYQECFEENLFGIASNSDLLMHIAKVSLNWRRRRMVLSIGVPKMGIYLCFKRVESLLTNAMSFKALFDETGGAQPPKSTGKGTRLVYFRLGRCSLNFCDDTRLDNTVIEDLDAVHYGTPRTVSILSTSSEEFERLKYSVSLELSQFSFFINKDKHSTQMKLERAISIYCDYLEEHTSSSEVTLFDIHNAKLKRQARGLNEIDVYSLFTATDILVRWEPDVHLSLYEPFLRLKSLVYEQRLQEDESISGVKDGGPSEEVNQLDSVDEQKKKEYMFAIDVETLMISAEVGHGVEFKLKAQSIFSENAFVGVLLEGLTLAFNGSRVFNSTRIQISRTGPSSLNLFDTHWDWLVQGADMHICIPYKLQLGAIADSIEDMLQGLTIITLAKEKLIIPGKRETSSKPKRSSPKFGCIRLYILKLTADIEEEPIQGWLDEHYQLMKKEACELAVRLKFLEDFIHKATQSPKGAERELFFEGNGTDVKDPSVIKKLKEKIHKRSFQAYYQACKGLVPSDGSGGYAEGFQAGFKPSAARTYLLSVCFTDFELTLTAVNGGGADLMEVFKNLDPISEEISASNVDLKTGSLVVQLRNYTLPLLSGTSGRCKARIVTFPIAQQATCSQPQTSQDVFVGRWRKVQMFQSANVPNKTYSDLAVSFQQGQVSFGVGYEPAFADISYALTMALSRRVPSTPPVPWWDEMRNNVDSKIKLSFSESKWAVLATTDPYESLDKFQIVTGPFELQQADSRISVHSKDFKIKLRSRESLVSRHSLNVPVVTSGAAFIEAPVFNFEVNMDWECLNLSAPLQSTSLSLRWSFSFRHEIFHWLSSGIKNPTHMSPASLTMNLGAHDLEWILKFCRLNGEPPHKLRSFSMWRYKVPRAENSKNLSQMITEFMLRVDVSTFLLKYAPWDFDDPAKGLTFNVTKLKYELCYARSECNQDALDLVYQGLDLHVPKAFINNDEGFIFSSDYLQIRRQSPKANSERLLAWQEAGRKNLGMTYEQLEFENGSNSDDDGYNAVIADNCQRVFLYGLKLFWTIENRDVVFSFVGLISRAFEPPKPSPSRQYKQRKNFEENQKESCPKTHQGENSISSGNFSSQPIGINRPLSSSSDSVKFEKSYDRVGKVETSESEEEGTQHFMVNVIEPQFNLHSEEANGRFLLAAVSGRVLARSFHSIMRFGVEVIKQALGTGSAQLPECSPEMTWTRMEYSVMLEHVQAHVAPTDVYPGAELQWLPTIFRNLPKVERTSALLERVFMPCDMYFRYTRHKGGNPDLKVKPLKELTFNSHNITASMTSRQFQVMLDVLTNLLFARLPKPRKSSLQCPTEDEDVEEEADEVVPYGVEEVELAKINLEEKERERKLLLDDIRKLSDNMDDTNIESEVELWMISTRRSMLVQGLKKELLHAQKSRKAASASLRMALQKAAQLRLMEKEKNKSPSYAMCISLQINRVVWTMLVDGKSFAEAEINDMIYDFDRDYKDIGVARFTTRSFVVRNCLHNAKSDILLSAWNPPAEWGKKVMLRVDAKQGAPKDEHYPLELFHVEIYPLRIHLTEKMYRMMWEYFFPEEEQDSQKRQEVWKISTTAGSKRVKKGLAGHESSTTSHSNVEASRVDGSTQELRRTSSFDRTWEENVAESVANELVLQAHSCTVSSSVEQQEDSSKQKPKETKHVKPGRSSHEEKKAGKSHEEKKSRPRKMMEFHNIKISQVELLVTYEGSRFVVNDLKLLMDTFHRVEFTGTWRRLFSRVKKHIIWGALKSVTGMQGKKFKDKSHNNRESTDNDLNLSDNDQPGKSDQHAVTWFKRQSDGAGDGFVTSIRGLFNTQRRKAKAFVLRTMRGEAENDFQGEWSDSDVEFSPFARQLTITKARRLIRRHTKKFRPRSQRGSSSQQRESLPSSPREPTAFESGYSSSGSSPYEDFRD